VSAHKGLSIEVVRQENKETNGKKLTAAEKAKLDAEIRKIITKPQIGVEKKGDLRGIYIHKFKVKTTLYLLV